VSVWEIAGAIAVVAFVYVLVRPQSKGADLVTALGDLFTATVQTVTQGTSKGA
jgi:hypothetical protein